MALDTAQKRMSAMDPDLPWRGVGIDAAESGFSAGNRQAAADLYSGISSGGAPAAAAPPRARRFLANVGTFMNP